jgi:hypothetical protein
MSCHDNLLARCSCCCAITVPWYKQEEKYKDDQKHDSPTCVAPKNAVHTFSPFRFVYSNISVLHEFGKGKCLSSCKFRVYPSFATFAALIKTFSPPGTGGLLSSICGLVYIPGLTASQLLFRECNQTFCDFPTD